MRRAASLTDARAQLQGLFTGADASRRLGGLDALAALPAVAEPRRASVLMLFGAAPDGVPATVAADTRQAETLLTETLPADALHVVLLSRATTLRSHPGQVAFPGGRREPGDRDASATALREAVEETGLDDAGVEILGAFDDVPLVHSQHLVTPVLGWWQHPSPVRAVDVAESTEVFLAPVSALLDPERRVSTLMRRGGEQWRGPGFRWGEHVVWGFTAVLLDALFDALEWTQPWDHSREVDVSAQA